MRESLDVATEESSTGERKILVAPVFPVRESRLAFCVRLFHVPQREQRPSQRGVVAPHSLHTYVVFDWVLGMGFTDCSRCQ